MNTGIASFEPTKKAKDKTPGAKQRRVSLAYFLEHYADREDGYKYEFNNGIIEKTESMNPAQLYIYENLLDFFYTLKKKVGGLLSAELITYTKPFKYRKPDLAYVDKGQIKRGKEGEKIISAFMVEIISENDQVNPLQEKVEEYFQAGVKVVWLIYPNFERVDVYTSPVDVKICKDEALCSAEPVIPGFVLPAKEVFNTVEG